MQNHLIIDVPYWYINCFNKYKVKAMEERSVQNHPCFCVKSHFKYARIHLPVAPGCNIKCKYCNRKFDCTNESMPGGTSKLLTPDEALERVNLFVEKEKNLSVVGIAGPGDPLANPHKTFKTFNLIRKKYPEMLLCLSTNGLLISKYINEIKAHNITHVTVTLNTVNPITALNIYEYITFEGKKYRDIKGMKMFLEQQLEGIKKLVEANILVKINTVLIPSINMLEIENISKTIKSLDVKIHNITGLIVKKEHNTTFAKEDVRCPYKDEVNKARQISANIFGSYSYIMHHCKQCRADSAGLLTDIDKYNPEREVIL
jgi:nitrogen fixation protein NifB